MTRWPCSGSSYEVELFYGCRLLFKRYFVRKLEIGKAYVSENIWYRMSVGMQTSLTARLMSKELKWMGHCSTL